MRTAKNEPKKVVVMLSTTFPVGHKREKQPTGFRESLLAGKKIHTIRRNHKSCGCCTRFKHEDAYGNGWCSKLNVAKECGDWCEGKFFIKKKKLRLI